MSIPEFVAVHVQLDAFAEQLRITSAALSNLRNEAGTAIIEFRRLLKEEEQRGRVFIIPTNKTLNICFVNFKSSEGGKFNGAKMMEFKGWAKNVKVFFNSQQCGFQASLEKAEGCVTQLEISDLSFARWELAAEIDEKLHNF